MPEENYPQPPNGNAPATTTQQQAAGVAGTSAKPIFPTAVEASRLNNYDYYEKLFYGQHFEAFNIKIDNELYGREYAKLRYIAANFAGLISKIIADLLFIEPPKIKVEDGDQVFVDELLSENKMRTQFYESGLSNSYSGDVVFKVRTGKRFESDIKDTVIIDNINPRIWFPVLDPDNVNGEPKSHELKWVVVIEKMKYLRIERHTAGKIVNELWLMKENEIVSEADLTILGDDAPEKEIETGVDRPLIIHIPNWRTGTRYFGISDYFDLYSLFYAINNRLTKTDNILDKHSDPILAVPEGILDEKGQVKRSKLNMFQRPQDATKDSDPAYITWDANLETAFKEIEKLVELTFMMSETAPDILGMGQGQSDSGRALKFKLLRTIAKAQRKQLYYREGIIELVYTAQKVAKAHSLDVNGVKLTKEPVKPEIVWQDGLPKDMGELIDEEQKRIDAGLTTVADSIMRIDDVDEDTAKKKAEEIKKETALALPMPNVAANANNFNNNPANPKPPVNPANPTAVVPTKQQAA